MIVLSYSFIQISGAFIIPYCVMSVCAGVPLYLMEVALGQYFAEGPIGTWRIICPLTRGTVVLKSKFADLKRDISFLVRVLVSRARTLPTQMTIAKMQGSRNRGLEFFFRKY